MRCVSFLFGAAAMAIMLITARAGIASDPLTATAAIAGSIFTATIIFWRHWEQTLDTEPPHCYPPQIEQETEVSHVYEIAATRILDWLHRAEKDLVGQTVSTFNGDTGQCFDVKLDELHGLCFTMDPDPRALSAAPNGIRRWYPVSTIRHRS